MANDVIDSKADIDGFYNELNAVAGRFSKDVVFLKTGLGQSQMAVKLVVSNHCNLTIELALKYLSVMFESTSLL